MQKHNLDIAYQYINKPMEEFLAENQIKSSSSTT
jgi:hypothetical protein